VEIGEVVDLPFLVDTVRGVLACTGWYGHAAAEDYRVEAARWVVVNPFCGEGADRV
jgi:hypothetical protein